MPMIALNNRRFGYEDSGGSGLPIVAVHGTFGRGTTFNGIAGRLAPDYRVIAPDLRGHGASDHGGPYDFVTDLAEFIEALDLAPALIVGHSLGGVTTYRLAAQRPELVRAMVIEDVGAVTDETELEQPVLDTTAWPPRFESRSRAEAFFAHSPAPDYFLESVVERDGGWETLFDPREMLEVQQTNAGNWWSDWQASDQPTLLLRATGSFLLSDRLAAEMTARRPDTELCTIDAGHWIHREAPDGYTAAVRGFVERVTSRPLAG
ncbi:alpha/beta fold hydrolase [Kribbella sp. NPDC050124]|uniref:alpha/beta fold hydrolase n=1 Tax=Kribbella sp. NPDC050124 TaxID=3364114 RepID=UPI0037B73546